MGHYQRSLAVLVRIRMKHSAIGSRSDCDGTVPVPHGFGPEGAEGGSGDQVTLDVEIVGDGGGDARESAGPTRRI